MIKKTLKNKKINLYFFEYKQMKMVLGGGSAYNIEKQFYWPNYDYYSVTTGGDDRRVRDFCYSEQI